MTATATGRWTLERGAQLQPDGSVRFAVWAPKASRVVVRVLTGAAAGDHELHPSAADAGVYEATIPDVGVGVDYAYVLEPATSEGHVEDRLLPDPVSRYQPAGVHGPSRVVDPYAFAWTDDGWRGVPAAELAIYELHVGTFSPEGTFDAVIPHLRELRALGVTAIEIMPVAQFPGERNWGYDGVDLYAVQHSYGGPEGLRRVVDAAHAHGLAVLLDVVYNHVGPEGNYLPVFGPYFTEKYRTPWGPALNYDDADSDEVRRFVIDNARHWVTEYHLDGLRLDAVHGIFDFSAVHLLQEIGEAVHAAGAAAGRTAVVIAESDLNDPRLVRPASQYGYGLDAQWSDDFHHAVHAALTGETAGYYSDFGRAETIGEALREPFVYAGRYSAHRRRRHGAPSAGIPRERFVVAVQNHDQVGNRATGDRLSATLGPEQLRLAAALLLLSPYVPLIFMGQEYGETNPFQYFVSHGDPQLVEAVRTGRRREFESFGWGDDVPDPQAEETFRRSTIERAKAARDGHAQVLALYRDLLALRRDEPILRPDGADVEVATTEAGAVALLRTTRTTRQRPPERRAIERPGPAMLALFNCAPEAQAVPVPDAATGAWRLRFTTEAAAYGAVAGGEVADTIPLETAPERERVHDDAAARGSGDDAPKRLLELPASARAATGRAVWLPPWSAALYERESD